MPGPLDLIPAPSEVSLGARGTTRVWDSGTSTDEAPLLLLHGWNIDAPANFGYAMSDLASRRRVVMFDHHGHGHGARNNERFSLKQAAEDSVAVLDAVGLDQPIVVGYSMGGAIAQLLAHNFPDRCRGLVLMATAGIFSTERRERAQFTAFDRGASALRRMPKRARTKVFHQVSAAACRKYPGWILDTVRQADPVALLEAGAEIGHFDSSSWIDSIVPPAAMVITAKDSVISPRRQVDLAAAVDAVHVETVDSDHDLPITNDPRFTAAIERSVSAVSTMRAGVTGQRTMLAEQPTH